MSCWEELKWADRRQCTILIVVFLSLSVFLCWDNVIAAQAWLGLAACLCPADSQNHPQALLMVLGSNRRQNWVSGRAVYAPRTNGNCGVIMRVGGGGGWEI